MNFSLLKYVDPEEGGGKDSKDKKRFATKLSPLLSCCIPPLANSITFAAVCIVEALLMLYKVKSLFD